MTGTAIEFVTPPKSEALSNQSLAITGIPYWAIQVSPAAACVIGDSASWYSPLTAMFLHGGWFHLLSNMWFLIVFGDNVEDAMGHARYAVFYVLTGLAAAAVQMMASPGSPVPMVGASGAISGVMGAYVILYPLVRVHTLVFLGILITRVALPAYRRISIALSCWLIPFFKDRELLARQRRAARLA